MHKLSDLISLYNNDIYFNKNVLCLCPRFFKMTCHHIFIMSYLCLVSVSCMLGTSSFCKTFEMKCIFLSILSNLNLIMVLTSDCSSFAALGERNGEI